MRAAAPLLPPARRPTLIRVARRVGEEPPEALIVKAKPSLKRRMVADFASLAAGEEDGEAERDVSAGGEARKRRVDAEAERAPSPEAGAGEAPAGPAYVFRLVDSVDKAAATSKSFSKRLKHKLKELGPVRGPTGPKPSPEYTPEHVRVARLGEVTAASRQARKAAAAARRGLTVARTGGPEPLREYFRLFDVVSGAVEYGIARGERASAGADAKAPSAPAITCNGVPATVGKPAVDPVLLQVLPPFVPLVLPSHCFSSAPFPTTCSCCTGAPSLRTDACRGPPTPHDPLGTRDG